MKIMTACMYIAFGIILGILIGHAQAKDDYRSCWDASAKEPAPAKMQSA